MKLASELIASIYAARVDREGAWKLTLDIPASEGPKVAALALHVETVFRVMFYPEQDGPPEDAG